MILELEDELVEEIRDILGSMFVKYRSSDETLRLSQWVDNVVVKTQKERQEVYVKANS